MAGKTNTIITIGRQFGSGGREIGQRLAHYFDVDFYDKEMLAFAAKESGICEELFEAHDEKPTNSFLYSLVMDTYSLGYSSHMFSEMPIHHKIFLAQFDAIQRIAEKGPCVLVGRCADYALESFSNVVNVFIHADLDARVERISRLHDISAGKAKDIILKTDKKRANYYNYYTSKKWSAAESYDLSLCSSAMGIEATTQAVIDYIKLKETVRRQKI